MVRWKKKDKEFIESCLDPVTREKAISEEEWNRWIGGAFTIVSVVLIVVYSGRPQHDIRVPLLTLILGSQALARSTANLRLARFAEAVSQRIGTN